MGTLFIVATPIGNLKDITYRAVEILNKVNIILSENTRISKVLLRKYDISTRLISYNDHNHKKKIINILNLLKTSDIALITDAGTPGISDPAAQLIYEARKIGIYWIHSYSEFNFDSLGSISRERLEIIGTSNDKF